MKNVPFIYLTALYWYNKTLTRWSPGIREPQVLGKNMSGEKKKSNPLPIWYTCTVQLFTIIFHHYSSIAALVPTTPSS